MFDVDPRFKQAQTGARKRRNQRRALRIVLFGAIPALFVVVVLVRFTDLELSVQNWFGLGEDGFALVQIEPEIIVAAQTPPDVFLDIAGDPVILRFSNDDTGQQAQRLAGSPVLDVVRFGLPNPERMVSVQDALVVRERSLMTALPSTREDFAFFQSQRNQALVGGPIGLSTGQSTDVELAALQTDVDLGDLSDSYGASLEADKDQTDDAIAATRVANTTSVAYVRREAARVDLFSDVVLENKYERSLIDVLDQNDIPNAEILATKISAIIPGVETAETGSVIAMRFLGSGETRQLAQLSYYAPDSYVGSVALASRGQVLPAADPWIDRDLLDLATTGDQPEDTNTSGEFRMLDALYSAAIRNGVPSVLVAEVVSLMSKSHDLERRAQTGDRVSLVYSPEHGPNGTPSGQIAYVGINGPSGQMLCYVVPDREAGGYTCFDPSQRRGGAGTGAMVSPVSGILTSKFGPRKHPIHRVVRLHAGVDWAAPTGTPVHAAAAGKVSHAGDGKGYGNLVIISHPGGLETRYAHLNAFSAKGRTGTVVQAGDIIGYVGTTGRSTGPHLHFETRLSGEPIDPMPLLSGGRTVVASGAVEALVAQIIKVESAGNARAKNPLSSATGLGQFITSTWLRMMRTYRPELASTMSRQDLLNLRFDPTLSREMVTRLAQENETYLKSRGHAINAGRLYLSHFLGPEGANKVLRAPGSQTILDLMGTGVVKANPFLSNYTADDLEAWADRKMGGTGQRGGVIAQAPAKPIPPELKLYMQLIDEMVGETG
ncbi:MAG: M23 family metallopeptidase [Aliishimia sp.]